MKKCQTEVGVSRLAPLCLTNMGTSNEGVISTTCLSVIWLSHVSLYCLVSYCCHVLCWNSPRNSSIDRIGHTWVSLLWHVWINKDIVIAGRTSRHLCTHISPNNCLQNTVCWSFRPKGLKYLQKVPKMPRRSNGLRLKSSRLKNRQRVPKGSFV